METKKEITLDGQVYVLKEEPKEEPKEVKKTKEQRLVELFESCSPRIGSEKSPDSIFFFSGKKYFFEYETKKKILNCSASNVYSIFETEYEMTDGKIAAFITGMVEEHFNCKGVTTYMFI